MWGAGLGFFTLESSWRSRRGVEKDISHCVLLKSLIRLPLTDSVTLASDFSGPQFPRVENGESVVGKVK